MAITLPDIIADYFAADGHRNADAVAQCFCEHAVVRDEGHSYVGRDAIRRWKQQSSARYSYKVEPFEVAVDGMQTVVTSHLVGNFPGSPVDLRYRFVLDGNEIAALEIGL